ncbi:MAG: hypothetical protein HKN60_00145 [Rhizobiales bacterium]|nr:hypothetical protein [Hyphomicrobiales bacterium]
MPRLTKARANQLFTASSKKGEQAQSEVEKERRAKAALTAKLRALRLARDEEQG